MCSKVLNFLAVVRMRWGVYCFATATCKPRKKSKFSKRSSGGGVGGGGGAAEGGYPNNERQKERERDRENREKDIFLLVSLQEGRPV